MYKEKGFLLWFLLFIVVLTMNMLTPLSYGDDYAYAFTMTEPNHLFNTDRPIRNLWDILLSQWNHWQSFNGRFTPHFLLQLFVGILGKDVFNVFNAFVFCGVVWLLLSLSDFRDKVMGILLAFSAYLLLMPSLSETVLWTAGSLNYLWTSFFVLLFIFWLRRIESERISFKHLAIAPISIFFGWTNVVVSLPVTMVICIFIVFHLNTIYKKAILPYMLFFVVGTLLEAFSPATFQRAHSDGLVSILAGSVDKIKSLLLQISFLKIFWVLCLSVLFLGVKNKKRLVAFMKNNIWLILILLCSFCPILLSGLIDARVRYGVECFSLLLLLRLLNNYTFLFKPFYKRILIVLALITGIFLIPLFNYQYANYANWKICEKRLKDPSQKIALIPHDNIPEFWNQYVRRFIFFRGQFFFLPYDKEKKETRSVSAFYGKDGMMFFPEKLWNILHNPLFRHNKVNTDGELYAIRINEEDKINKILLKLNPIKKENIPFYHRILASKMVKYNAKTYEIIFWGKVILDNGTYLVFAKPDYWYSHRISIIHIEKTK